MQGKRPFTGHVYSFGFVAMEVAEYFDLKPVEAKAIIADVREAVSNWRKVAASFNIYGLAIERMARYGLSIFGINAIKIFFFS